MGSGWPRPVTTSVTEECFHLGPKDRSVTEHVPNTERQGAEQKEGRARGREFVCADLLGLTEDLGGCGNYNKKDCLRASLYGSAC